MVNIDFDYKIKDLLHSISLVLVKDQLNRESWKYWLSFGKYWFNLG